MTGQAAVVIQDHQIKAAKRQDKRGAKFKPEFYARLAIVIKTIHIPSIWMENGMNNVTQLREKTPDSEKITVNLGYVDLGRIDLLVQESFYSNRSDFIRTAIRKQIETHADIVSKSVERQTMELGLRDYTRADLEVLRDAGEILHVKVVGLARIASDVTPELALQTIGSITVLGAMQAPPEVRAALANRIR